MKLEDRIMESMEELAPSDISKVRLQVVIFQRRPNGLSWRSKNLRERPGPSQQITNFCKSVSHILSMHLIVSLVDYNNYHFTSFVMLIELLAIVPEQ